MQSISKSKKRIIFALGAMFSASGLFAMNFSVPGNGQDQHAAQQQDPLMKVLNTIGGLYKCGAVAYGAAKPLADILINRVRGRSSQEVDNKWWTSDRDEGSLDYIGRMLGTAGTIYTYSLAGGRKLVRMADNVKTVFDEEAHGKDIRKYLRFTVNPETEKLWCNKLGVMHKEIATEVNDLVKDLQGLNASRRSSFKEKNKKYKQLSLKWHPDKNPGKPNGRLGQYQAILTRCAEDIGATGNKENKQTPGLARRVIGALFS